MVRMLSFLLGTALLFTMPAQAASSTKASRKPETTSTAEPAPDLGPVIKAYKRDPLPIFNDAGERVREVDRRQLPPIGSPGARVVRAKPGFVGIMLDGELAWLRLSMVDYVGDVKAIKCDAVALQFAKMEEEGLDQSLGLGCAK